MIQPGTQLIVQDNSGARIVECITVLKKKGRNFGKSGSFAVVSVKKLRNKGRIKVKKKEICIAMILKTRKNSFRKSGMGLKFSENSCILLTRQFKTHGTRVFGTMTKELRNSNFIKTLSLASSYV